MRRHKEDAHREAPRNIPIYQSDGFTAFSNLKAAKP